MAHLRPTFGQQSEALDLLLEFTQAQSSKVSEAVPKLKELKGLLEKVGGQVDALDSKILQLELHNKKQDQRIIRQDTRIETLEKNASKAAGAKVKRQQRVLLGQAAYALVKIDKDLANLLPDQKSRWEAV